MLANRLLRTRVLLSMEYFKASWDADKAVGAFIFTYNRAAYLIFLFSKELE